MSHRKPVCGGRLTARPRHPTRALAEIRATTETLDRVVARHALPTLQLAIEILHDVRDASHAIRRAAMRLSRHMPHR